MIDETTRAISSLLSRNDMREVFSKGEKPPLQKGIGIERECFLYRCDTKRRLVYTEIEKLLRDYIDHDSLHSSSAVMEKGNIIGVNFVSSPVNPQFVSGENDTPKRYTHSSLSLEPGGQFEVATRVHAHLHDAAKELDHVDQILEQLCQKHGFFRKDIGFEPFWTQNDLSWMPKGRYDIMREYMPKVGSHGLDMMRRTCTLQVNLDYEDEQNMADMMFVAHMLTPLAGALFAASPFYEGTLSPYTSYRHHVWQNTDHNRSGLIPAAFQLKEGKPSMRYDDYVDYLLSVPMYFVSRGGYKNYAGKSFSDFIRGDFAQDIGHATLDDFYDHMTVAFPEVRLKTFIEIRCIDASPVAFSAAAFFVGILYNKTVLHSAIDYIVHELNWDFETVKKQYDAFPKQGLRENDWAIAKVFLDLSRKGLKDRDFGEEIYLKDLQDIIETKTTYSDTIKQNNSFI